MACIEERRRKNGTVTYYVRWIDPASRTWMTQKVDLKVSAELLLTVLRAHSNDVGAALRSTTDYFSGVYSVTRMIEEHIEHLTNTNGYTNRRFRGNLKCHIADDLGTMAAADVEYRDIVRWVKQMQAAGLSAKTIANVHGLIFAALNTIVLQKKRSDNPWKGVPCRETRRRKKLRLS